MRYDFLEGLVMKKIILIAFILVTGYFIFQQYKEISKFDNYDGNDTQNNIAYASNQNLTAVIPESCSALAQDFEHACYGTKSGNVSYNQQVFAYRKFKSCLKEEGLSEDEIKTTLIATKQNANNKLKQDGYIN